MIREIRFAFRRLARSPGFVVIAVVTLALAIGASTAVLSLVNALLIRPLPYRAPQQLVLLLQHFKSQNLERIPVSPPEFVDYESRAQDFEKMGAFGNVDFNLVSGDKPERIAGAQVTANVFPLLGVTPIKGRFFEPTECQVGRNDVMRLVIGRALKLIAIGTAIGLLMALFSTRALQALLYRVSAVDLPTFFFVAFVLGLVALAASYLPAQRATRSDPMVALSHNA